MEQGKKTKEASEMEVGNSKVRKNKCIRYCYIDVLLGYTVHVKPLLKINYHFTGYLGYLIFAFNSCIGTSNKNIEISRDDNSMITANRTSPKCNSPKSNPLNGANVEKLEPGSGTKPLDIGMNIF